MYGDDDRSELHEVADPSFRALLAERVLALVPAANVNSDGSDGVELSGEPWGTELGACDGVRFAEQISVARCTALLVSSDWAVTASHCVTPASCPNVALVRGYYVETDGTLHRSSAQGDVRGCSEVESEALPAGSPPAEVAWIRVGSPFATPATILEPGPLPAIGDLVSSAGYGGGIPMKAILEADVFQVSSEGHGYFLSNLDAFHGASGSPIFDQEQRVNGLLLRGGDDFYPDPSGCLVERHDSDVSGNELAISFSGALRAFCETERGFDQCQLKPHPPSGQGCSITENVGRKHAIAQLAAAIVVLSALVNRRRRLQPRRRPNCAGAAEEAPK